MVSLIVSIIIIALIIAIAWWALSQLPLPDPVRWIIVALVAIVAILFLASLLPIGGGLSFPRLIR